MRITYTPLHRLTKKLLPDAAPSQDHLGQLEFVFTKTEKQNQVLTEKLDGYRLFMQKSLPPATTAFNYPYPRLHELADLLNEKNFSGSKTVTGDIFRVISDSVRSENNLPDFFVCCILVDMLTVIANFKQETGLTPSQYRAEN